MEYTTKFMLNKIDHLEDKLRRIEDIIWDVDMQPSLKISMIHGVIHPNEA